MAEIKNIGAPPSPVDQNAARIADDAVKLPHQQVPPDTGGKTAVGRDAVGQPVGLPPTDPTTQNALMPDAVTGRDPSQLVAAEKMRSTGGHSATDVLLGLDRQPSTLGVVVAPPGNLEALRHLTPAMRRAVLRSLLSKQRSQMRRLAAVMREGERDQQGQSGEENADAEQENGKLAATQLPAAAANVYNQRALQDLAATTRMLDLLDELLGMQDYTLSQMGTFAQG